MVTRDSRGRTEYAVCDRRGQSLILALMIMFLLVFIGGVFIMLIARNVRRAQRSSEVLTAEYLAEAGIRYADDQLTYGLDGADWRPVPNYPRVVRGLMSGQTPQALIASLSPPDRPDERDPDFVWLMQGYSRFNYGRGRFLIRVTYNPRPDDPMSRYIKIESIGRMGNVSSADPTTWRTDQPLRARREKVAYKAIGITDYVRFVTNKDRRPGDIPLGTPGFVTNFGQWDNRDGDRDCDPGEAYGGSIRVNGDLLWHGTDRIWLDPLRGESVEVAGDIRYEVYSTTTPAPPDATEVTVNKFGTRPSAAPDFSTIPLPRVDGTPSKVGSYRDGRMVPDNQGLPRGVARLDPPLLDPRGPGNRLSRYRDLTRNSGEWKWAMDPRYPNNPNRGWWYNTGYYGWGKGLYINNRDDVQKETSITTLRADWTNPGHSEYWNGPYYAPPGVIIVLTPFDLDNGDGDNDIMTGPDMIITRYDGWYDKDGNYMGDQAREMYIPYPENGLIFAEGNIRIKGMLPPGKQLTVVSGATIYIEGSILKYRPQDGSTLGPPDSAIALLATDNICVNTTRFFGPIKGDFMPASESNKEPRFEVSPGMEGSFWLDFAFGDYLDADNDGDGDKYVDTSGNELPVALYVRHTSDKDVVGASYVNMLINFLGGTPQFSLYRFPLPQPPVPSYANWVNALPARRQYIYPLADTSAWADALIRCNHQNDPEWEHQAFNLWPNDNNVYGEYTLNIQPGVSNRITFQLDPGMTAEDYMISRAAVQPCDVRIEALMYAQNGSFFVIPGEWFNPNPTDTRDAYYNPNSPTKGQRPEFIADARWPFYGDPLDVKITIFGAISENLPAPIGDVKAWMDKWGWIPHEHGHSGELTVAYRDPLDPDNAAADAPRQGLCFIYDPQLSCPRLDPLNPAAVPVRSDSYMRVLPIVPNLPVSPQTLYMGEPT